MEFRIAHMVRRRYSATDIIVWVTFGAQLNACVQGLLMYVMAKFIAPYRTMMNCYATLFHVLHNCLPWKLVCNGLWECPGGTEEMRCNRTECPGMSKCRNSSICLSYDNLCDSIHDCHLNDDEQFCSMKSKVCPSNCSCLLLSLSWQTFNGLY